MFRTLRASSPLRLLTPAFPSAPDAAAVCLVTLGGGLLDGDQIDLEIVVERGASLVVFTQSSTKVFRGASAQRISARVAGTLMLLPDPVSAFGGARYTQRVEIDLVGDGSCVILDGFTAGRPAFGERWQMHELDLRTTIRRVAGAPGHESQVPGDVVVEDALRLDRADLRSLRRFEAVLTLTALGPRVQPIVTAIRTTEVRPPSEDLVVATSALPRAHDGALTRIASSSPTEALGVARLRLRNLTEIGGVDPFTTRH